MDVEAGRNHDFKNYVKSMMGNNKWEASEGNRVFGITRLGQRFALVLIYNLVYYVYKVVELRQDGEINISKRVEFIIFKTENAAKEYMTNKRDELQLQNTVYPFDNLTDVAHQKLKTIWGREVYRIHDFDDDHNPFIIVLMKTIAYYSVIFFIDSGIQLQTSITKYVKRKPAEEFLQKERNRLKRIPTTEESMGIKYEIPFADDETAELLSFPSDIIFPLYRDEPDFASFVEKSVLRSFRGEEAYRKYGFTEAGQQYCFVVSKTDYFIVHVVLEPNPRAGHRKYNNQCHDYERYSRTVHLRTIKTRPKVDEYVEEKIKQFLEKSEIFIDDWTIQTFHYELSARPIEGLLNRLERGDRLHRHLRAGSFAPTTHDGIYLGNGKVAHYTTNNSAGFFNSKGGPGPGIVTLEEFLKGEDTVYVSYQLSPDRSGENVAKIAEYLIKNKFWDQRYHLISRNCQLFAYLCTTTRSGHRLQQRKVLTKLSEPGLRFILKVVGVTFFCILQGLVLDYVADEKKVYLVVIFSLFITGIITFGVVLYSVVLFCIYLKVYNEVKKTLKIFKELENRMELGLTEEDSELTVLSEASENA